MQKPFYTKLMLAALLVTNVPYMLASEEEQALCPFREAGKELFSVHGIFRDMVVKRILHNFVHERLPNQALLTVGGQRFDIHDIFIALSDACANILDAHLMRAGVDYRTEIRHACVGSLMHKLWIALLNVTGIEAYFGEDVKDAYNKYGKAWFSKAFALSVDRAFARLQK